MIVQIQGGTDPMRAMSQQLPQMAVGFGAWGAAIGVVAAAMPALISYLSDATNEMRDQAQLTDDLSTAIGNVGRTISTVNMDNWVEQWNAADAATRQAMETLLEFDRISLEIARRDALSQVSEGFATAARPITSGGGRMGDRRRMANIRAQRAQELADTLGLTPEQLREVNTLYDQVIQSGGTDMQAVLDLQERLVSYYEGGNEALKEQIRLMGELFRTSQASTAAGPSGTIPTGSGAGAGDGLRPVVAQTGSMEPWRGTRYDAIYQAALRQNRAIQEGFEEAIRLGQDFSNNVVESFSLATEAGDIFARTFESAADGVARGTQSISDAFQSMVQSIILQLGKLLATQGIGMFLQGQGGFFGSVGSALLGAADGAAFNNGRVVAMAKGGIVRAPTLFPMANGAGLMGEAGPEAVLPLGRGPGGKLGVYGGGMNVTVNNNAPGVSAIPRETDQGLTIDVVLDRVATDIRRGGNMVAESIEQTYAMSRGRGVY